MRLFTIVLGLALSTAAAAAQSTTTVRIELQAAAQPVAGAAVVVNGTTYPIQSELTFAEVNAEQRSGKDAQKVAIGAAIGAGIGQILGKDTKSTVIGAATGAAAGTAVAMGTANYEGCIPQGGRMTISLTAPATIGTASNQ